MPEIAYYGKLLKRYRESQSAAFLSGICTTATVYFAGLVYTGNLHPVTISISAFTAYTGALLAKDMGKYYKKSAEGLAFAHEQHPSVFCKTEKKPSKQPLVWSFIAGASSAITVMGFSGQTIPQFVGDILASSANDIGAAAGAFTVVKLTALWRSQKESARNLGIADTYEINYSMSCDNPNHNHGVDLNHSVKPSIKPATVALSPSQSVSRINYLNNVKTDSPKIKKSKENKANPVPSIPFGELDTISHILPSALIDELESTNQLVVSPLMKPSVEKGVNQLEQYNISEIIINELPVMSQIDTPYKSIATDLFKRFTT